jgi:hypothetical protein
MKTNTKTFATFFIFISIIWLCVITSCTTPKNLEDKCILKDPRYRDFVMQHGLEEDINDFLK